MIYLIHYARYDCEIFYSYYNIISNGVNIKTAANRLCSIPVPLAGRHGDTQTNKPLNRDDRDGQIWEPSSPGQPANVTGQPNFEQWLPSGQLCFSHI